MAGSGGTPLNIVSRLGEAEAVEALLAAGARLRRERKRTRQREGWEGRLAAATRGDLLGEECGASRRPPLGVCLSLSLSLRGSVAAHSRLAHEGCSENRRGTAKRDRKRQTPKVRSSAPRPWM